MLQRQHEVTGRGGGAIPRAFLGILGKMPLAFSGRDLAPRRGVVQHEADMLRRFGKGDIYRRGEGMHEIRVARRVKPEEAPAEPAEVALRLAGRYLTRTSTVV